MRPTSKTFKSDGDDQNADRVEERSQQRQQSECSQISSPRQRSTPPPARRPRARRRSPGRVPGRAVSRRAAPPRAPRWRSPRRNCGRSSPAIPPDPAGPATGRVLAGLRRRSTDRGRGQAQPLHGREPGGHLRDGRAVAARGARDRDHVMAGLRRSEAAALESSPSADEPRRRDGRCPLRRRPTSPGPSRRCANGVPRRRSACFPRRREVASHRVSFPAVRDPTLALPANRLQQRQHGRRAIHLLLARSTAAGGGGEGLDGVDGSHSTPVWSAVIAHPFAGLTSRAAARTGEGYARPNSTILSTLSRKVVPSASCSSIAAATTLDWTFP